MTVLASDANTERVFSKGFAGTSWNGTSLSTLELLKENIITTTTAVMESTVVYAATTDLNPTVREPALRAHLLWLRVRLILVWLLGYSNLAEFKGLKARAVGFGKHAGDRPTILREGSLENTGRNILRITLFEDQIAQRIGCSLQPERGSDSQVLLSA